MTIKTNYVPRITIYGCELSEDERKDFDYVDDIDSHTFFRYRGQVYDPGDFITTSAGPWNHGLPDEFRNWHGYASDSYFSGVLIRFPNNNDETIICARYFS